MLNRYVTNTVHIAKQQLTALIIPTAQDNDRVRGAQVNPVLGGIVVERQQLLDPSVIFAAALGNFAP